MKVEIQCQLRDYTCNLNLDSTHQSMILSLTEALSHGFMSFVTSEWIGVIVSSCVHAVREKLSRVYV